MFNELKNRLSSNRADSRSMSEILMIVGAVVVALAVTTIIAGVVGQKTEEMKNQVNNSTADVEKAFGEGRKNAK